MSDKSASKKPLYRRIPGFRSGIKWKMAVASFFYLFIILSAFAGEIDDVPDPLEPPSETIAEQQEQASDPLTYAAGGASQNETEDPSGIVAEDKDEAAPTAAPAVGNPTGKMKVHFIDVGQGDAILIQTPSQNILIDGGNRGTTVLNYLKNQGIKSLDLVVGTHPHADHIGGLINVMQAMPVKEVIDPGVVHTTKTFEDYLTVIDQKDIIFTEGRAGMVRDLGGGAKMEILHPSSPTRSLLNDASIVARVTFGKISFMLTGDAEQASEYAILNRGYTVQSTILKVGHHGSRTSTITAFLNAVKPDAAIIMVGANNRYGHPHQETLSKLTNAGVDIYRTDNHGTIVVTTDGQRYEINVKEAYQYNPPKEPESQQVTSSPSTNTSPAPAPNGRININSAGFEELQEIIHIGPDRAQQIINLRPFKSLDDLTKVNGIGPARLQAIKDEGKAYVQ